MASPPACFRYRPLEDPHNQIRLLRILADSDPDAPVRCHISHVPLVSDVDYSALSYVWGDLSITKVIVVDDCEVDVTSNLESALRHLRAHHIIMALWVDALCINQSDVGEKSIQVQLMSQIYRNAKYVLCWLGDESAGSDLAFMVLTNMYKVDCQSSIDNMKNIWAGMGLAERLGHIRRLRTILLQDVDAVTHDIPDIADTEIAGQQTICFVDIAGGQVMGAIRDLLRRPWWRRTWVCQELLLTKLPIFVCGSPYYQGWQIIGEIAELSLDVDNGSRLSFDHEPAGYTLQDVEEVRYRAALMRLVSRKYISAMQPEIFSAPSLVDLIYEYQDMECADPRDKVYAMLGIATDDLVSLNTPDYSLTNAEILERLLISWTRSRKSLDIVTYRPPQTRPTWRPSFGTGLIGMPLLFKSVRDGLPIYSASLAEVPEFTICEGEGSSRILHISGFHIDNVLDVGPPKGDKASVSTLHPTFLLWRQMAAKVSASPFDFWYTLTAEMDAWGTRPSEESVQVIREELAAWILQEDQTRWPKTYQLALKMSRTTTDKFFITKNERMGMGNLVKPGDAVCILFGGQAPFLLREAEHGMYEMIEDCYVNGVMGGEAMKEYYEGRHTKTTFKIC
jgi:hypothetical protein